ncbi:uroporphyrinogen-III synthase [Paracoccus sp. (in: a-proteobacteria)]|uniref:uroporphyrinogen-III synthase n=1 Tax=Paracoccus sp. TaxID=267 RepID=UPI0035B11077
MQPDTSPDTPADTSPVLLLTRPELASRRFAAEAAPLGLKTIISPVLRIVPVAHDGARLAQAAGLVFTSLHAVPAAGPGRGRPAICVGPATAQAARAAGFDVTEGPGDAARMLPLLQGLGAGWLHPHGAHVAKRLPVPGMVVYDQLPQPLSDAARQALAGRVPVILPLFSPRSAGLLSEQAMDARAPLWLVPISPAAAARWQAGQARMLVADTPDAGGILRAVETLCKGG